MEFNHDTNIRANLAFRVSIISNGIELLSLSSHNQLLLKDGVNSVHRILQQLFSQVNPLILSDVAIEHCDDVGAAAKVLLAEVIPNLLKQSLTSPSTVINLTREVECKEEAAWISLDILAKVDELKHAQKNAKEANEMHAREVYSQKAILASKTKELQLHVVSLSDEGDRSLGVLDEMRRSLEMKLAAALINKEAAEKEKLEKETSAREALAYQESQMERVVEESNRLKQEAYENSKLQKFLVDRGHVISTSAAKLTTNVT